MQRQSGRIWLTEGSVREGHEGCAQANVWAAGAGLEREAILSTGGPAYLRANGAHSLGSRWVLRKQLAGSGGVPVG